MGFLDKMKAAAGVGTAGLEVDVRERPSARGGSLAAVMRVVGGKQNQKLHYLVYEVGYEGTWPIRTADGVELTIEGKAKIRREKVEAANEIVIEAGKTYEFPVNVGIPTDGPVSSANLKYYFGARADIEGTSDPKYHTEFEIKG